MFAVFGNIFFETLISPEGFTGQNDYTYAEHKVVETAPRLQWIANDLRKISLDMQWHVSYINPATQWNQLVDMATSQGNAWPLVYGNGVFEGYFVIQSLSRTMVAAADDGSIIALQANAELKEWIPGMQFDPTVAALPSVPPPGIISTTPTLLPLGSSLSQSIPTLQNLPQPADPTANPPPLLPLLSIASLGVPTGISYSTTDYSAPGVSAIAGSGSALELPGNPNDVAPSTIVRSG